MQAVHGRNNLAYTSGCCILNPSHWATEWHWPAVLQDSTYNPTHNRDGKPVPQGMQPRQTLVAVAEQQGIMKCWVGCE